MSPPPGVFREAVTEFEVDARALGKAGGGPGGPQLKARVTNPSGGTTDTFVDDRGDGTYRVEYTPYEEGPSARGFWGVGNPPRDVPMGFGSPPVPSDRSLGWGIGVLGPPPPQCYPIGVWGLGCHLIGVWELGFWGIGVWGFGVLGSGVWVLGSPWCHLIGVLGFGIRVLGFGVCGFWGL